MNDSNLVEALPVVIDDAKGGQGDEGRKVDWLDLPEHLLPVIAKKFTNMKDLIRLGAVCRSWQSVYNDNRFYCLPPNNLPLLMLPTDGHDKEGGETRSFYDLSAKRVYDFKAPVPHDMHCRGSTFGWLICVHGSGAVRLLNPFSSSIIELPPLTAIRSGVETVYTFLEPDSSFDPIFMSKVVLSGNPASDKDYVVMAIYGAFRRLAFCKPGDAEWTCLDTSWTLFNDIIYYRNNFYAIDHFGVAWVCDDFMASPLPKMRKFTGRVDEVDDHEHSDYLIKYIVELCGELLQVRRKVEWPEEDTDRYYFTTCFQVLKLDMLQHKWFETKDLCGHMLFLGDNTSISLLASDYPGCKPNCIYFTDDYMEAYTYSPDDQTRGGPHDMAVYNLNDQSIQQHYHLEHHQSVIPAPIWIHPPL